MCFFGPISRDNPLKCFQHLQDISQLSRQLTRARPKCDNFLRAAASKASKIGHLNFQGI